MKNFVSLLIALVSMSACNNTEKAKIDPIQAEKASVVTDTSSIDVYYFHGEQRCKTCIAVGKIAKETVERHFSTNNNVHFIEVNTSEKAAEALIEKYEVAWNALIIANGKEVKDLTEKAFATALSEPKILADEIQSNINSMIPKP